MPPHRPTRRAVLRILAAAAVPLAAPARAPAAEPEVVVGDLRIAAPMAFSTPTAARNGAAYLTVRNVGATADRLVGGTTPAAARVELHTTVNEGGVMRMRALPAIEVPAGGTLRLQRGGLHVMLLDLREPLKAGARFPLVLEFERAGRVEVSVAVEAVRGGHHNH